MKRSSIKLAMCYASYVWELAFTSLGWPRSSYLPSQGSGNIRVVFDAREEVL